jgi:hypothetical protein
MTDLEEAIFAALSGIIGYPLTFVKMLVAPAKGGLQHVVQFGQVQ